MPQQDFLGLWTVRRTSGTPFGVGTEIDIGESGENLTATVNGQAHSITYLSDAKLVQIDGIEGMESLMLAVFRDPPTGYRAVYGGGLSIARNSSARIVVCAAETDPTTLAPEAFKENSEVPSKWFKVVTTSGTQFGVGSSVELQPVAGAESGTLTITNALDELALALEIRQVDGTTGTFKGTNPEAIVKGDTTIPLSVQFSVVQLDEQNPPRIFGIQVVGDPENSGVWGGDEEDPPDGDIYPK